MKSIIIISILTFPAKVTFGQKVKAEQKETTKPFVPGVIEEIQSKALAAKRGFEYLFSTRLPQKDSTTYLVFYLLDGSAKEDFIPIVGLVQFNNFEWVNQVPKSIVVGIAPVDRQRDFYSIDLKLSKTKTFGEVQ